MTRGKKPNVEAAAAQRAALDRYGGAVGGAFQIADDLLDLEGDPATLGNATGKDATGNKATLVSVLGTEGAELARYLNQ